MLADAFGTAFIAAAIAAFLAAMVGYWLLSKWAPRGAVLGVAVALWLAGAILPVEGSRLLTGVSGVLKLCGFAGVILGLVDLFRKGANKAGTSQSHMSALQHGLGPSAKNRNKPK